MEVIWALVSEPCPTRIATARTPTPLAPRFLLLPAMAAYQQPICAMRALWPRKYEVSCGPLTLAGRGDTGACVVCSVATRSCACFLTLHPKMRSGKASCTLDTVWEDKRRPEATAAACDQELPAMNGPSPEEAREAEAADPRRKHDSQRPLLKKRKRSPRGWLDPTDLALVGLSADHVWLDKPFFDQAETCYRQRLADAGARATHSACVHGNLVACHHVTWGVWVNKSCFDQAERAFVEWSQALLLAAEESRGQGARDTGSPVPTPELALACQPSLPASSQPPLGNLQALVREVWLDKPRYDAAERGFYEALFDGHPPGKVRLQERAGQAEGARRGRRDRRSRSGQGSQRPGPRRSDGEGSTAWPCWYFLHRDAEAPWLSKPAYDSAECRHHAAEALRTAWRLEATSLALRPGHRAGPSPSNLRPK